MSVLHEIPLNAVIRASDPQCQFSVPHRILHCDVEKNFILLFCLNNPHRRPRRYALHEWMDDWTSERIVRCDFPLPSMMVLSEEEIPKRYKEIRDRWWKMFEPLLNATRLPFLCEYLPEEIKHFSETRCIHRASVYTHVYRFFYYGCIPNAFLPRFDLRGGPGKARILGTRKIGVPRKAVRLGHNEDNVGINISEDDKAHILDVLQEDWVLGDHATFSHAYELLCEKFYADIDCETDHVTVLPRPSYRQFVYHAKRLPEFPLLLRLHVNAKRFDREYRAIICKSSAEVYGPAQRYQIDATVADLYLTSTYDRSLIIGRPVIYLVADVFTKKYVGLYIGLEGPSWEGARLALLNAFLPKDEYLRRFGLEDELTWSANHIPASILADRAELLSNNALGLTTGLGITIDIASGYRPDLKGIVERKFGLLNTTIHFLPGAVRKRNRERGERHYALDGTLNLWDFTRVIIREIVHFNAHHQDKERRTPAMITAGIKATPDALWDFGMEHLVGGTPFRTREEIYAHLLPQDTATVHEDGIHFKGLRYTSSHAMQQRWFEKARYNKCFSVPIRFNKEIPERIWILSNVESELRFQIHEATLVDEYHRYENLQLDEIRDLREYEELLRNDELDIDLASKVTNKIRNDRDLKRARKEAKATVSHISRAKKSKNIRPQNAVEKQSLREQQANYEVEHYGTAQRAAEPADRGDLATTTGMTQTDALIWKMLRSEGEEA